MTDRDYMQMALDMARAGIAAGQSPFGACIVRDGAVLACEHNAVWADHDATAHAEVRAIRAACQKVGDVHLDLPGEGATIYATTEPCPMCFTAIHWARIGRIVYSTTITDSARFGFHELTVNNATLAGLGQLRIDLVPRFMRDEGLALFADWQAQGGQTY